MHSNIPHKNIKVPSREENFDSLKHYNFWEGNVPLLGFLREYYTNTILTYTNNKLIKVLVGQRRAGKSYILRQVAHQLITSGVRPENIFYINKEFIDFAFVHHYKGVYTIALQTMLRNMKPNTMIFNAKSINI